MTRMRTPEIPSDRTDDPVHAELPIAERRRTMFRVLMRRDVPDVVKINRPQEHTDRQPEHPLAA